MRKFIIPIFLLFLSVNSFAQSEPILIQQGETIPSFDAQFDLKQYKEIHFSIYQEKDNEKILQYEKKCETKSPYPLSCISSAKNKIKSYVFEDIGQFFLSTQITFNNEEQSEIKYIIQVSESQENKEKRLSQEKNKKILQKILTQEKQKNLYLSHTPTVTDLIAVKNEKIRFTINTEKIDPKYVIFYFSEDKPHVTDCSQENCSSVTFTANFKHAPQTDNLTLLVQTKTGMYDKIVWNIETQQYRKSYIQEYSPEEKDFGIEIDDSKTFTIKAHDDNSNLWKIILFQDYKKIADTGEKCYNTTHCSLSHTVHFDRFDIEQIYAVIHTNFSKYLSIKSIVWKPKIVKDYYQEITLPKLQEAEERNRKELEQEAEKRILAEKQKKLQEEQREQELNAKLRREARKKKGRDIILGFTYFLFFTGFLLLLYKKRYAIQSLYQRWKINRLKEAEAKRKKQIILEKEEEKRRKEAEKQKVLEAELARQQKLQQEADELNKKLKAIEEEEKLKAKIEIEKQEKIRKEKERIKQLEDEALERRKKELQAQDEHGLKFAKTVKDMFVEDLKKLEEETKPKKKKATSAKKSTQKKKPKSSAPVATEPGLYIIGD